MKRHLAHWAFWSLVTACLPALPHVAAAQVGRVYPSERTVVKDALTGVEMVVLTNGQQNDVKIYQTHPQWTADGQWIVFRSSGRSSGSQLYAVHEASGTIVQLTEGAGNISNSLCLAKRSMAAYYLRNATEHRRNPVGTTIQPTSSPAPASTAPSADEIQVIRLDLQHLLDDTVAGKVQAASVYERVCATFPTGFLPANGQALDADEQVLFVSVQGGVAGQHLPPGETVWQIRPTDRMGTGPGALRKIDLATGKMDFILDTPFQIGHVQNNPWVSGEIVYCHETGGDAPQRMWTVRSDGTGNRPLFKEEPLDWVTHETVVTRDEVMFNLIGMDRRLRARPTGIAVVNLRTDAVLLLGQVDELPAPTTASATQPSTWYGGFWHCNGSADGRWAVGDTFSGNLWLIDRRDGRRILLSTDHKMKPDHAHPTFSDDGTRIEIQSGKFTEGKNLQIVVIPVPASFR